MCTWFMEFVIAYSFLHSAHWLIKFMTVLLHISFTIFYIEFWQFSDLLLFDSSSYIENCHSLLQEDREKTILLENQQKNYTSVTDTLVFDLENPEMNKVLQFSEGQNLIVDAQSLTWSSCLPQTNNLLLWLLRWKLCIVPL